LHSRKVGVLAQSPESLDFTRAFIVFGAGRDRSYAVAVAQQLIL
jgi:hypothetical protein